LAADRSQLYRLDLSETITIVVSNENESKEFTVHTSYATKSSGFIRAAMNPNWKEGHEKRITISDHEPATFEGYLNWVYSERITLEESEELCGHCVDDNPEEAYCSREHLPELVDMFILGDYLNDLRFCNAIVDVVKHFALKSSCLPPQDAICCVWERTSPECQSRKLFLQQWANELESGQNEVWLKDERTSKEFVVDLLVFVGKRHSKSQDKKWELDKNQWAKNCSFHTHVDDSDKCS
jgi:hypothetical protein